MLQPRAITPTKWYARKNTKYTYSRTAGTHMRNRHIGWLEHTSAGSCCSLCCCCSWCCCCSSADWMDSRSGCCIGADINSVVCIGWTLNWRSMDCCTVFGVFACSWVSISDYLVACRMLRYWKGDCRLAGISRYCIQCCSAATALYYSSLSYYSR